MARHFINGRYSGVEFDPSDKNGIIKVGDIVSAERVDITFVEDFCDCDACNERQQELSGLQPVIEGKVLAVYSGIAITAEIPAEGDSNKDLLMVLKTQPIYIVEDHEYGPIEACHEDYIFDLIRRTRRTKR